MSGPKVVRVVTREEIIATCQGHVARLDKALERWIHDGERLGLLSAEDSAAARRRRDQIAGYLAADRFVDLQKAAPEEIVFLTADLEDRREKAARAAAQARQRARREVQAVASLLSSLERRGVTMPDDVRVVLERAARGEGDPVRAFAVGSALARMPAQSNNAQDLARRLKDEEPSRSIDEWLRTQSMESADPRLEQIDLKIEQLAAFVGRDDVASFEVRLRTLAHGAPDARHNLLTDSLTLDVGRALTDARALRDVHSKLDGALAELRALDGSRADALEQRRLAASEAELSALLKDVEAACSQAGDAHAASARREAVLKGLAELGYEVGAAMEAAWVKDGALVLKKPAQAEYGVELSGGVHAERLQMRVVAFSEQPDPARDRDAETLWCADVGRLEAKLSAVGSNLHIEKAYAIGAAPLKRLSTPSNNTLSRSTPLRDRRIDE